MASLTIAFTARKIARRPADERMTFGYGRIEIVAALINCTTLISVGVYLIYEGAMPIVDPPEVRGWTVVVLGAVAVAFGATKTIGVTLKDGPAEPAVLAAYGDVLGEDDGRVLLRVDRTATPDVAGRILHDLPVADLTIEDPPIEDVIEQVFASARPNTAPAPPSVATTT